MKHLDNIQRQAQNRIMLGGGKDEKRAIMKKWFPVIRDRIENLFFKNFKQLKWKTKYFRESWNYNDFGGVGDKVEFGIYINDIRVILDGEIRILDEKDCFIEFHAFIEDEDEWIEDAVEISMKLDPDKMKIKRSEIEFSDEFVEEFQPLK